VNGIIFASYGGPYAYIYKINGDFYPTGDETAGFGGAIMVASASGRDNSFTTKKIYGYEEHRDQTKVWRSVNILIDNISNVVDTSVASWNLEVTYSTDLDQSDTQTETVNLGYTPGSTAKLRDWKKINLMNCVGPTLQVKFRVRYLAADTTNYYHKQFKIYEMTAEYNLRGRR
jgi:hypothetical protein